MHILCSWPCDNPMTFTSISDVYRVCVIQIMNVNINDLQWSLATLPIKVGGIWLRSPVKLALSTYPVSVSSILQVQNDLLRTCPALPDNQFNSYLFCWTISFQPLPSSVDTVSYSLDAPLFYWAFVSYFISFSIRYSTIKFVCSLLQTVVIGYMNYQFHSVAIILTVTL